MLSRVLCFAVIPVFFASQKGLAQQRQVALSGVVRDLQSGEPLPTVNIRILESTKGTSTNLEGAYRILLAAGSHRILVSCIGYRSDTLEVLVDSVNIRRDVSLQVSPVPLPEVLVVGDQRDPGEQIILKAIANKQRYLSQLHSYRFNAYTKTTLRVEKKTETSRDTIIGGLLETQTEGYWEAPDRFKEVITARRQSANFSPNQNMFAVGPIPNLNDDVVSIESNSIIGPTAPNALEYYSFKMIDTSVLDNISVYRIRVKPRSTLRPLFDGVISIADRSFQVVSVDVRGNEAFDLAPLTNARMRQQFALFGNKFWLPTETITTYTVNLTFPPVPPVLWEQYSLIYNYEINPDLPKDTFDKYLLSSLPTADRADSSYWQRVNLLPLTGEEARAYVRIDSIVEHAGIFVRSLIWLARLPIAIDELPITDLSDFFHFNRVEGAYLGGGFRFSPISMLTMVRLRAGYGFSDRQTNYSADIEQWLTPEKNLSIGGTIYRSLAYREGKEFIDPGEITYYALLDRDDPVDYYRCSGWSVFARENPLEDVSLDLRYIREEDQSVTKNSNFSFARPSEEFRSNPPIASGNLRSVVFQLTHDTRKFVDVGFAELPDDSKSSLLVSLAVEHTDNDLFASDFDFTRYSATSHLHLLTFSSGALDGFLTLGYSTGALPPQRIFDLFGTTSSISHEGSLRTIGNRDYAGDRIISFMLEHNFGSLPFRAVGVPFVQHVDFILTAGGAWTGLSENSKVLQTVPLQTTRNAIVEVGFGLGRLLSFFRLDFSWRLTEQTGRNFALTLGSALF